MDIIKHLRKKNNITQTKLAQKLGVSRSTIAMYEINRSEPDQIMLIKLADFFGVSVDYLLNRTALQQEQNNANVKDFSVVTHKNSNETKEYVLTEENFNTVTVLLENLNVNKK